MDKKLEKDIVLIAQKVDYYKSIIEGAKPIIGLINKYSKDYSKLQTKLGNEETGVVKKLNKLESTLTDLSSKSENLVDTANQKLNEISGLKEKATSDSVAIQNSKSQNDTLDQELEELLKNARESKENIDTSEISASVKFTEVVSACDQAQKLLGKLRQGYKEFTELKGQIDDETTGLSAIHKTSITTLNDITALKEQGNVLFAEILKAKEESGTSTRDIEDLKNKANLDTDTVRQLKEESEEIKIQIGKIYQLATDTGLAGSFSQRKGESTRGVKVWGILTVLSVILLTGLLVTIHIIYNSSELNVLAAYRLTMAAPLIYLVYFCTSQYSRERNIHEKYAFKAATALALDSYTTLLSDRFNKKHEEKILNFVLNSMQNIYKEPYEEPRESIWRLIVKGTFGEGRAEIEERPSIAKDPLVQGVLKDIEDQLPSISSDIQEDKK